jgi:hypothetical protein
MPEQARGSGSPLERWLRLLPARSSRASEPRSGSALPQPAKEGSSPKPPTPPATPVRPTVLVTVLGLSGRALEEILELVVNRAKTTPIAPVFITDTLDFGQFRRRRLRFEYVPDRDRQQRFAPKLDWDLYLRHRYALLGEKWQAQSVISFGRPPPHGCVVNGRPPRRHGGAPEGEVRAEHHAVS